ncbi:MAG: M23 family metallopeptidase [Candidatus Heteroscillospira sp.]|jgi:murein DD-endopeptidase MepM/ murein hydrolase activator NlpD
MREWKLYAAAGIFLVLTAVKMAAPELIDAVRDDISCQIDKNLDYEAAVVSLGRRVEACSKYVERQWAELQPTPTPTASPEPTHEPTPAPTPAPSPTTVLPVESAAPSEEDALPFDWAPPLESVSVSSGFGVRLHPIEGVEKLHSGLDMDAAEGQEILAFAGGTVETAEYLEGYGNCIVIRHEGGYSSLYAHCSELLVGAGNEVGAGDTIALAGHTGNATGPHLHFELHRDGEAVDPAEYLC